jgi:transmembrane sensor
MNNVYELPKREDKIGQVSEWIAKVERGLTEKEEKALHDWLAADPENSEMFMEMASVWDRMDSLSRLADLFPEPVSRKERSLNVPLAMAASVLLAVLVGLWTAFGTSPVDLNQQPGVVNLSNDKVFETAVGEQSTIKLPDGSELTLNTDSLIHAMYSENQRTLVLERGEVNVKVAHDKSRPFNVYVGDKLVQAVGTEFNLEITSDQRIELIVTEGKVLVGLHDGFIVPAELSKLAKPAPSLPKSPRMIEAGELLVLNDVENDIEQLEPEEIEVKLSWRGGDLVFRGESLAEAISEIERYTPVEFVILGEDLKKVRVAGLFKAGDVDGLLTTLRENFDITYERISEEKIILTSK